MLFCFHGDRRRAQESFPMIATKLCMILYQWFLAIKTVKVYIHQKLLSISFLWPSPKLVTQGSVSHDKVLVSCDNICFNGTVHYDYHAKAIFLPATMMETVDSLITYIWELAKTVCYEVSDVGVGGNGCVHLWITMHNDQFVSIFASCGVPHSAK